MNRLRVIIADTDDKYIATLQLKFIKEYFDKIDLEVITEKEYFEELFITPQKVEILIVSDTLYSSSLKKHDIANIFIMTEHDEENENTELNINYLHKYISIQHIFNEILGRSASVLDIESKERKETQIVLVTSANGGVGKTIVALGMSGALTKSYYKRVLYINVSGLQSFQYMLNNKEVISASEIYSSLRVGSEHIYSEIKHIIRKEQFYYLPEFKASLMSLGLDYEIYEKFILSAKNSGDYDYIIVDAESKFDEYKTNLLDMADMVFVIMEKSISSIHATNTFVSNITKTDSDKYVFICNKFQKDVYQALTLSNVEMKFPINEYINLFDKNVLMRCEDLAELQEMRKVAFLAV